MGVVERAGGESWWRELVERAGGESWWRELVERAGVVSEPEVIQQLKVAAVISAVSSLRGESGGVGLGEGWNLTPPHTQGFTHTHTHTGIHTYSDSHTHTQTHTHTHSDTHTRSDVDHALTCKHTLGTCSTNKLDLYSSLLSLPNHQKSHQRVTRMI